MEREANYAAVGAFVLLVIAMAGIFVYWYSDSREKRDYVRYEVYFENSVNGLEEGGPVRYLGVDVGRVWRILLDRRAADRVEVIVDIDATTPISDRTLAQLSLQGVTGVLYIDLQQEKVAGTTQKVMAPVPSQKYPVIRSVRSTLDTFVSSLPEITVKLADLVARVTSILSDENVASLANLIGNLDKAGNELPAAARNAGAVLADLRVTLADSREVIHQLQQTATSGAPNLATALDRLRVTAEHMATASEKLDSVIADNRDDLRNFTRDSLPQFDALVRDARQAAQEFSELSRSLRSNPSQLIYQAPPRGVEIPK